MAVEIIATNALFTVLCSLALVGGVTCILLYTLQIGEVRSKRVAILVLGDIGRSPRMQNHAVSLAKAGWNVDLIGFRGTIHRYLFS